MQEASKIPGAVVWLTGLSGAGKTTVSEAVAAHLRARGVAVTVLDGDVVRQTVSRDLGYSAADRATQMRRLGEMAFRAAEEGAVVLVAAIGPLRAVRAEMRAACPVRFAEVWVDAPLAVCERRDTKGLYRRARRGEVREMTGVDAVYEPPERAEVHCRTAEETVEESAARVVEWWGLGFEF